MQKLDEYKVYLKKSSDYTKIVSWTSLTFFGVAVLIDLSGSIVAGIFLIGGMCFSIYYDKKVKNDESKNIDKKLFQIREWFGELDYKKRLEIYEKYK